MSTCRACGGVLGRDCFNEEECLMILHSQQQMHPQEIEQMNAEIHRLTDECRSLSTRAESAESKLAAAEAEAERLRSQMNKSQSAGTEPPIHTTTGAFLPLERYNQLIELENRINNTFYMRKLGDAEKTIFQQAALAMAACLRDPKDKLTNGEAAVTPLFQEVAKTLVCMCMGFLRNPLALKSCVETHNSLYSTDDEFYRPYPAESVESYFAASPEPRWVKQEDSHGCVVAALAMIVGKSYGEVKSELQAKDLSSEAYTAFTAESYLYEHGYRLVKRWKHVCYNGTDRQEWPISPFAPIHYVSVQNGTDKAHAIVMLENGNVLDPWADAAPRKLTDYAQVNEIIGVYAAPEGEAHRITQLVKDNGPRMDTTRFQPLAEGEAKPSGARRDGHSALKLEDGKESR